MPDRPCHGGWLAGTGRLYDFPDYRELMPDLINLTFDTGYPNTYKIKINSIPA
jgi:hypothetical protein